MSGIGSENGLFSLQGRVALVTGAASGIGAATAQLLARAGADVSCGWFAGDPHDVEPTRRAAEALGRRAIAIEADVATDSGAKKLVEETVSALGQLDIVVANAGITRAVPFEELDEDSWRPMLEVNLGGVYRSFRAALPALIAAGHGRLLATSSVSGTVQGWAQHAHYTAAKAGISGLVKGLAVEVAGRGVTVNAVAPGVVETPQTADRVNSLGPAGLSAVAGLRPVGRNGRAEEIAAVFVFLASDEASFVTGQTIVVDGGSTLDDGAARAAMGAIPPGAS
jgi:3-oxoacyl-[acyl-carrier protein] reductase